MDEFQSFILLLENGIPADFRSARRGDVGEVAFFVSALMDKLEIPPERVYCEGYGWANPLKAALGRRGITISRVKGSEEFREANFEAGRAYRLHHLRECAEALRVLEERKV